MIDEDDLSEFAEWLHVEVKISNPKVNQILERISKLDVAQAVEAYPIGPRVEVEIVEAYGLEFGLDSVGNATRVLFPNGADVS